MSWWSTGDELVLAVLILFGPGTLVGWLGGLRRVWLLAVAPAISVATFGSSAVVFGFVGVPWSRLTAAAAVAAVAVVVVVARRVMRRRWRLDDTRSPAWWVTLSGLAVSLPLAFLPMKRGIVDPGIPAQTWDAVFHLNAVRWVLDHGDASSLHLGAVATSPESPAFYPAGWHAVVSLVVTDSIVAAVDLVSIVIACVVWPLGVACLVSVLIPRSVIAPFVAPVLAAGFIAFPARMLSYGTLWPNALAYALLPVALALTARLIDMVRTSGDPDRPGNRVTCLLALIAVLGGAGVSHPNAVIGYVVLSLPIWLGAWWRVARHARGDSWRRKVVTFGLPAVAVAFALVLAFSERVRSVAGFQREQVQERWQGVWDALTDSQLSTVHYGNAQPEWTVLALVVAGTITVFVQRWGRWLVSSLVIAIVLYTLTLDPVPELSWMVGPWYSDPVRLGGLVALALVPLAAVGVVGIGQGATSMLRRLTARRPGPGTSTGDRAVSIATLVVLVVVVAASGLLRADVREERYWANYAARTDPSWAGLVTADEVEMLEGLSDELPEDALVLANPYTGGALVSAIGQRDVVFPHITGVWGDDERYLAQHFYRLADDPRVCEIVERLGITHVYADDMLYWRDHPRQVEFRGLWEMPPEGLSVRIVDSGGGATVFEITACGLQN